MAYFIVADLSTIWGWGRTPQAAEALAWWNAETLDMLHEGPRLSLSDHRVPRSVWADRVDLYECTEVLYRLRSRRARRRPSGCSPMAGWARSRKRPHSTK